MGGKKVGVAMTYNTRDPCGEENVLCLDCVNINIPVVILQFLKMLPIRESG